MYKLKQLQEDFIVKEISEIKFDDSGIYYYFLLKKRGYNTLDAINIISEKLRIDGKNIGFSGNKDRNAVTEQVISIKNGNEGIERLDIKDIELKFIGKGSKDVFLGSNIGNDFEVTIRNLNSKEIKNIENRIKDNGIPMPNYFGPQRFSNNNPEIGKSLVKKDFKKAVELILGTNSDFNNRIVEHLEKKPNDHVVALKIIPSKLLKFYIHSYQSSLFNKALGQLIKNKAKPDYDIKMPIIGFGSEIEHTSMKDIIEKLMKREKIGFRDFIIRQIPELSSEGDERKAFIKITDFKIAKKEEDELNNGKEKITAKFSLPKGCYATVLIDYLFKD